MDGLLEAVVERLHQVLDGRNAAAVFNAAAMAAGGGRGTGALFSGEGLALENGEVNGVGAGNGLRLDEATLSSINNNHNSLNTNHNGDGHHAPTQRHQQVTTTARSPPQQQHAINENSSDAGSEVSFTTSMDNSSVTDASTESGSDFSSLQGTAAAAGAGGTGTGRGRGRRRTAEMLEGEVWSGGVSSVVGLQMRGLRGLMEGRRMRERGGGGGGRVNGGGGPRRLDF